MTKPSSVLRGDPVLRYQQTIIADQFRKAFYANDRAEKAKEERDKIQKKINDDIRERDGALAVIGDLRFSVDEAYKVLCETDFRFRDAGEVRDFKEFAESFQARACDSCSHATAVVRADGQPGAIVNCPQHAPAE